MNSCYLCLLVVASIIIMAINWQLHHLCAYTLHTWIMVDYAAIIVFRLLMFVDDRLAAGIGLDLARQQGYIRFCARIVLLSILIVLLYPFLWVWTIVGTIWFAHARDCVSFFSYTFVSMTVAAYVVNMIQNHFQLTEEDAKFGYLIWLLFSYCGLVSIACICIGKWLTRRQAHQLRAQQQGIPMSEFRVLVDLVRVRDRTSEIAARQMRGDGQDDAAYNPGLYSTPAQGEPVEALIQELPKFRLKAVPTECSECLICLEEFHVGNEVRGLPCAHNFHVECIDKWLQLNAKCPRCRCSANLDVRALPNIPTQTDPASPSPNVVATTLFVRNQPLSPNYILRFQGLLSPVQKENAGSNGEGVILEMPLSRGESIETVQVVVDESAPPQL